MNINDIKLILTNPYKEPLIVLLKLVNLNSKEKSLLDLYYFQGKTQREIASAYGIDERTVRKRLNKIKNKCLIVWKNNSVAIALIQQIKKNELT